MKSEEQLSGQPNVAGIGASEPRAAPPREAPNSPPPSPPSPPDPPPTPSAPPRAPEASAPPARVEAGAPAATSSNSSHAPARHLDESQRARREPMAHERRVLLMALAAGGAGV